jgi:hypothetical protein
MGDAYKDFDSLSKTIKDGISAIISGAFSTIKDTLAS